MGHFITGHNKVGGREVGTLNKRSLLLKETFEALSLNVSERIATILPDLPKERQMEVLLELMGYLYPRRKAIDVLETSVHHHHTADALLTENMTEEELREKVVSLAAEMYEALPGTGPSFEEALETVVQSRGPGEALVVKAKANEPLATDENGGHLLYLS